MRQLACIKFILLEIKSLYLWRIKSTQKCDIVSIKFFPRLFLHENNVENYLTKFKFKRALIKVKLQNYFLK